MVLNSQYFFWNLEKSKYLHLLINIIPISKSQNREKIIRIEKELNMELKDMEIGHLI